MSLQMRTGPAELVKVFNREVPTIRQHRVDHRRAVSLGQNKSIALGPLWILWIVSHEPVIKRDHYFHRTETAAHVARISSVDHRQYVLARLASFFFQLCDCHNDANTSSKLKGDAFIAARLFFGAALVERQTRKREKPLRILFSSAIVRSRRTSLFTS